MQPALTATVNRSAAWYREELFWPVQVVEDGVVLRLGRGVVACEVPADRAVRGRDVLEHDDIGTAALLVAKSERRVAFLAEADESVFGQFEMRLGVHYLTVPIALRLPLLAQSSIGDRTCFCTPDTGSPVVSACCRSPDRGHHRHPVRPAPA